MRKSKILLFIFLLFLFQSGNRGMDEKAAMQTLDKIVEKFKSFKGKFEFSVSTISGEVMEYEFGKIYFKKGGKTRWEYENPKGKLVLSNGKEIYIYLENEKTLYKLKIKNKNMLPPIVRFFFLEDKPSSYLFCAYCEEMGKKLRLELAFSEKEYSVRRLYVVLNEQQTFFEEIGFVNEFDERIKIRFSDGEVNKDFDDNVFRMDLSKDTIILEDYEGLMDSFYR